MIRRIGQPPLPDQRYTLRAGAYAILPLQKRLLLTAQVSDFVDIQLPGGGIDPGESPIHPLHREVMEETGWRIAAPKRIGAFLGLFLCPITISGPKKFATFMSPDPRSKSVNL